MEGGEFYDYTATTQKALWVRGYETLLKSLMMSVIMFAAIANLSFAGSDMKP